MYSEGSKFNPWSGHCPILSPFSCRLRPATEELGIEGDGDNFGIECPDIPGSTFETLQTDVHPSTPTYPWPSQEKKAVLSWAKELSAHNVPTLHALKKCQERICKLVGNPTKKKTTNTSHVFYQNSVARAIANDYSNLITRCSMQDYPEEGDGSMSQVHHGTKMLHDLPFSLVAPFILINGKIYFVDELLQQSNGAYFIPKKIFQSPDQLGIVETLAIGHSVVPSENHPVRTVPLIIFMDNVSSNVSKQWNKHHVVYLSNTLMPRKMLEKEFSVWFVSSSPHAAPMELMKGVTDSIREAADLGVITWDCKYEQEVMLLPYILFVAGDNPMHAEKMCKVGGTQAQKKTNEGYQNIFKCGPPQNPEETQEQIHRQVDCSLESGGNNKVKTAVTNSGIRNSTSASIVQQLLALGKQLRMPAVDIHQDTPTEILHTVLLGVVKYFWGQTVWLLKKSHLLTKFQTRLKFINKDGLNTVMPYMIYDLVSQDVLDAWSVIGDLVVLLWHTKIDNTKEYLIWPSFAVLNRTVYIKCHRTAPVNQPRMMKASAFITQNGDEAKLGSYVVISSASNKNHPRIGQVIEILVTEEKPRVATHIVITYLEFLPALHPKLLIPCLQIMDVQDVFTPKNFLCTVNVLHDCCSANCSNVKMVPVRQEYSKTTKVTQVVTHKQFNQYLCTS
ncbi:hypothetical protein SERLADRAFT_404585 [Serpula lacrymans var. lacrymans S7.9]|uniref:Uncharacterized protein n=1 Tax=Serpula lacrymans var. lacrymans (strain S7.9) TaxID=578457 RepID=F8NDS6_SERL9|nr:uncharacterized protein SERLADRAFT_404585 [Serpula lacrymans var. lacrymans S7.9]EGO30400.1 hypothetical protein SERLADRAFT_404585 [Serpula lacrymans var. lacrymans S7.9]